MSNCAIILAGGEGKRMKSDKPKPMSLVLGKPMLQWVFSALKKAGVDDICVVKGYHKEYIEDYLATLGYPVESVYQKERLGTGHAVMMAKDFLSAHDGNVVILNGDAPFMTAETIKNSLRQHTESGCAATVISAELDDATGYGRIVRDENGNLRAIVEHKDADEETLKITEVNSGGYWFDCQLLLSVLGKSSPTTRRASIICPTLSSCCLPRAKPSAPTPPSAATRCWGQTIPGSWRS